MHNIVLKKIKAISQLVCYNFLLVVLVNLKNQPMDNGAQLHNNFFCVFNIVLKA